MQNFFQGISNLLNTFGAAIFVPVILFFIDWIIGTGLKKALMSALYAGIGLIGFTWLVNEYVPIISPMIKNMAQFAHITLPAIDIGWQAVSIVAYSTKVGMMFLGVGIVFQLVLYLTHWTNIFQLTDMWTNYSYMAWGALIYMVTQNVGLALGIMLVLNLYSLLFAEWISKRWSTYYGYPHCTIIQLHHLDLVPYAMAMNWLLNKLGANRIKWSPEALQKKLGFIAEPIVLGTIIGAILGFLGNMNQLNTAAGWASILKMAICLAAVMAIFPRVAAIFAQAFSAPSAAFQKLASRKSKGSATFADTYIGINDAVGYGETATILSGTLLIPICLIEALVLPGNLFLPVASLTSIPYMVEILVAVTNGNIFKVVVSWAVWFVGTLYMITATSPIFTKIYSQFATTPLASGTMIGSGIVGRPIWGTLVYEPVLHWGWIGLGGSLVVYFILYAVFKKNKNRIQDYMEKVAQD
jgi:PTS system galactitol-specific IIC component